MGFLDNLFNGGGLLGNRAQQPGVAALSPLQQIAGILNPQVGQFLQGQAGLNASYNALQQSGVPSPIAQAAALNPEIMKTIAPAYFDTQPKLQETGTDPLTGQKSFAIYRPNKASLTQAPVASPQGQTQAAGVPATMQQVFGSIEKGQQSGAPQEQLLQNVPASMRNAVQAMIEGKAIPSNFSFRGASRDLAVRLAHMIDPTFDETLIPQRQQFARGMAQTTPNSPGGQKLLLNTALQHAAEASQAIADLHNRNGPLPDWIPGSAMAGNVVNAVGNSANKFSDAKQRLADSAQKLSGEVGRLYSGAQGGGEYERLQTAGRFSASSTPEQFIGALTATKNLILDKLNSLQNQRDQVYGQKGENIYPLVDKQTQAAIQKIDETIAKLRGGGQPQVNLPQGWSVKVK